MKTTCEGQIEKSLSKQYRRSIEKRREGDNIKEALRVSIVKP